MNPIRDHPNTPANVRSLTPIPVMVMTGNGRDDQSPRQSTID
jgi:hypothetical protein